MLPEKNELVKIDFKGGTPTVSDGSGNTEDTDDSEDLLG